jgi:hypothetical protein
VSNEIDRVRDVDQVIVSFQVKGFELPNSAANSELFVQEAHARIGINTFGVPPVICENPYGITKAAGDIEEPPNARRERREEPVRAAGCDAAHGLPLLPKLDLILRI